MGDAVGDVVERGAGEPFSGEDVRHAGRVCGKRLGGDAALGRVERDDLLAREKRLARRELGRAPGRRLGERRQLVLVLLADPLRRVFERRNEPLAGDRGALADAEDGDDDVLREELEIDVVVLAHHPRDAVARGAEAANIDDQPGRVVRVDARAADDALVEDVEARNRADPLAKLCQAR